MGDKTAATLLGRFTDIAAIVAAAADPASDLAPGPRGKIKAAADYLAVAPEVVAVARDLELGPFDARLPRTPADPARVAEVAQRWGVEGPVARVLDALTG